MVRDPSLEGSIVAATVGGGSHWGRLGISCSALISLGHAVRMHLIISYLGPQILDEG